MVINNTWNYFILLILSIALFCYIGMDEEPFFDLTDLNVFHIVWFFFSILAVFFDNYNRILVGQYSENDRSLYSYLISYTLNLLLYFMVIWAVFFMHIITPLNLNLVDDSTPSYSLLGIFSPILCNNLFSLLVLWLTAFIMSRNLNSLFLLNILCFINFIICVLLVYWTLDFTTTQITSTKSLFLASDDSSLVNSNSSVTYADDVFLNGFEWHLASNNPHVLGFMDFASLLIWVLFFVWFVLYFIFFVLVILASFDISNTYIFNNNVIGFFLTLISFVFLFYVLTFVVFFSYWFLLVISTCGLY